MKRSSSPSRSSSIAKATRKGGIAGRPEAATLWSLPKRAILEIALRLANRLEGDPEDPKRAIDTVKREYFALRQKGLV